MHLPKSYKTARTLATVALVSALGVAGLTACGSGTTGDNGAVTPQGTIDLNGLKVGVPEAVLKQAVITFVLDDSVAAKAGGKHQYMSRPSDSKGGQYLAQCKDDYCYELQAYYQQKPISRDDAMDTVKHMLPPNAPAQSRVDDSDLKDGKGQNVERIYFGDDYLAEIFYKEPAGNEATIVNVYDLTKNGLGAPAAAGGAAEKASAEAAGDDAKTE